jgi:hypothetical protein
VEDVSRLIGGPALVTLQFKDASAQEVFASLTRQAGPSGLKIRVDNEFLLDERKERVTVDLVNRPIWDALRETAPLLGLSVQAWTGSPNEITLSKEGTQLGGPAVNRFPCIILIDALRGTRTLYTDTRAPEANLNILFQVLVEPKLYTLPASFRFDLTEAQDETGRSLLADARAMVNTHYRSGRFALGIQVENLVLPAQAGRRLSKLRGTLRFLVRTKSESWQVPDILRVRNLTKTVVTAHARERYEVTEAVEEDDRYSVIKVKVTRERLTAPGHDEEQAIDGEIPVLFDHNVAGFLRVVDAEGKQLTPSGGEIGNNERELTVDFQVSRIAVGPRGKPATLIWEIPLEYKEVVIPFEFNDLPLP